MSAKKMFLFLSFLTGCSFMQGAFFMDDVLYRLADSVEYLSMVWTIHTYIKEEHVKKKITKYDAKQIIYTIFEKVDGLDFYKNKKIYDEMKHIFLRYPYFIDIRDDAGWTLLHEAAHKGNLFLVIFLESLGANMHAQTSVVQDTPLHLAIRAHRVEVYKYFDVACTRQPWHVRNSFGEKPHDHHCIGCKNENTTSVDPNVELEKIENSLRNCMFNHWKDGLSRDEKNIDNNNLYRGLLDVSMFSSS